MNTVHTGSVGIAAHASKAQGTVSTVNRSAGFIALAMVGTYSIAFAVLTSGVNWLANQLPAAEALPLIQAQANVISVGYSSYLASSIYGIALALVLRHALARDTPMLTVATTFGVLAGVMKVLGVARWIVLMPVLAQSYTDPKTSASTREMIAVAYTAFNTYAGGIGEQLGTILFTSLWVSFISIAAMQLSLLPRWLNILGIVSGLAYSVGMATSLGLPVAMANLVGSILTLAWLVGLAVVLLRHHTALSRSVTR